jgi:hypothetical protein
VCVRFAQGNNHFDPARRQVLANDRVVARGGMDEWYGHNAAFEYFKMSSLHAKFWNEVLMNPYLRTGDNPS